MRLTAVFEKIPSYFVYLKARWNLELEANQILVVLWSAYTACCGLPCEIYDPGIYGEPFCYFLYVFRHLVSDAVMEDPVTHDADQ